MEAVLLATSVLGAVASVFVFLAHGRIPGVLASVLSLLPFAVSRLFDLPSEIMRCVGRMEEQAKPGPQAKVEHGS
jgi:hypothetical protein